MFTWMPAQRRLLETEWSKQNRCTHYISSWATRAKVHNKDIQLCNGNMKSCHHQTYTRWVIDFLSVSSLQVPQSTHHTREVCVAEPALALWWGSLLGWLARSLWDTPCLTQKSSPEASQNIIQSNDNETTQWRMSCTPHKCSIQIWWCFFLNLE